MKLPLREHQVICERVRNGESLAAIAADYGVTRERIRQVAAAVDPTAGQVGKQVRAALHRERTAVTAEVRTVQVALHNGPCRVCGGPVTRRRANGTARRVTCGSLCRQLWVQTRYQLDEHERRQRLLAHARWVLRNSTAPTQRRHAQRFLDGTAQTVGRWTTQPSTVPAALATIERLRAQVEANGEGWWR